MKVRKSLKIDKQYVIGTVGRLTEAKNQKFLIDLFADIHKKNAETILLIVGDGELRGVLEQQVKNLGLSDYVIFTGNKSNTQDYYQAMDVFVFPSLWGGLGISSLYIHFRAYIIQPYKIFTHLYYLPNNYKNFVSIVLHNLYHTLLSLMLLPD